MTIFKEVDVVRTVVPVEADVVGKDQKILIPKGTLGTVVLVHGSAINPVAYEIEFNGDDPTAIILGTVGPDDIAVP